MQEEIWKVYPHKTKYTCLLEISNLGNVRRNNKPIDLSIRKTNRYYNICGKYVHRMVAELFVDNPNNYNEIDHINAHPHDNRAVNLRWCTHKDNINNIICRKRLSNSKKGITLWNKGKHWKLENGRRVYY